MNTKYLFHSAILFIVIGLFSSTSALDNLVVNFSGMTPHLN